MTDEAGLRKNPLQDYTEDEKQELVKCLEALGEIVWGNPLTLEVWASFHIRREFLTGFPIIFIQKESNQFGKLQSSLKTTKNDQKTEIENKPVQLTLFD